MVIDMKKKHSVFDVKLDAYEQEISDAIDKALDKGKLKKVARSAEELAFSKKAATNFLRNAYAVGDFTQTS